MDEPLVESQNIWRTELNNILRGAFGGLLFGIPLLYTVEVWSIGSSTTPPTRLLALAITFVVVYLLNLTAGFRRNLTIRPSEAAMESIEAMAIGLICALLALILLRRITLYTPLSETLGKLIFEGIPFSLGVALARSTISHERVTLQKRRIQRRGNNHLGCQLETFNFQATLIDLDATLIGALIVAFSIAPTEEIPLIASSIPHLWLLLIIAASLVISYGIVFASGFTNQRERQQESGLFQQPLTETAICYLLCLVASALMLWFFQQLSWQDPWQEWLSDILVLGLPASIGGAAGRLVI